MILVVQSFCDISLFVDAIFFLLFLIPFYCVVSFSSYFDFISFYFYFTQGTFLLILLKKYPFYVVFKLILSSLMSFKLFENLKTKNTR